MVILKITASAVYVFATVKLFELLQKMIRFQKPEKPFIKKGVGEGKE